MTDTKVPAVYKAFHNVLKDLAVQADGTLPGNMGGKAYRSAEAIADAVKGLLVKNNLIMTPIETKVEKEIREVSNRVHVFIQDTTTFRIHSIDDESYLDITGTGDGIAIGNSVASNVSETNSLKNALRKTFLISDTAAEEHGLQSLPVGQTPVERNVAKAAQASAPKPAANSRPAAESTPAAKDVIREQYIDTGKLDKAKANSLMNAVKGENPNLAGEELWAEILVRVEAELGES